MVKAAVLRLFYILYLSADHPEKPPMPSLVRSTPEAVEGVKKRVTMVSKLDFSMVNWSLNLMQAYFNKAEVVDFASDRVAHEYLLIFKFINEHTVDLSNAEFFPRIFPIIDRVINAGLTLKSDHDRLPKTATMDFNQARTIASSKTINLNYILQLAKRDSLIGTIIPSIF